VCVAPSKITLDPQSQLVHEGVTLNLSCKATGSDPIRYQWRRVNGEITSNRAKGINTSTLTISSVAEQDEDEYYCVASNNVKDESKTAVVAVLSKNAGTVVIKIATKFIYIAIANYICNIDFYRYS